MHSKSVWKLSRPPNYRTNVDKRFPYSELPYVGEYNLIRIPQGDDLIELVDYWGEGRIQTEFGASGFTDSYCVNHEYQLVSNGPDRNAKIPNRVPVVSYDNCDTSGYIKDNSVKMVTVMGAPINASCAADIARIVNRDEGKVIAYGFKDTSPDIKNLDLELGKKGLVYCFGFELAAPYKEPTLFDSYRTYLNVQDISEELYKSVNKAAFAKAVKITKTLDSGDDSIIADVLDKLLKENNANTMIYAYKLWVEAEEIVKKYFPVSIKLIYEGASVKILNKKQLAPLKLESNVEWKFRPSIVNNKVYFSIRNVGLGMFLDLDSTADSRGQRKASGYKPTAGGNDFKWVLQPVRKDDDVFFAIVHGEYRQALKYGEDGASSVGQGDDDALPDAFGWFVIPEEENKQILVLGS